MVTIKDGCGCDPCDCDWKQKLKEAYARASVSVNKVGDETGRVYYPDGTGFVKVPLPTKEQIDSLAEIDAIKASVDELNVTVPALETQVTGVTESLVSDVKVLNGTTAGKFKVRIEREKAGLIDSNDYDLSKVNSIELIQGSGPAMVKAQLTLSDGTVLRSDDFLFTSESIGTDVYISSFTFKNGNVDGTISADIGLNNGTTLEANNFVVPTDPSVVSTITDLQTRMTAVEGGSGVSGLDELKATVETHTSEITQLTNDVGELRTSKVNVAQGTENAGKILGINSSGNVEPTVIDTGGNFIIQPVGKVDTTDLEFFLSMTQTPDCGPANFKFNLVFDGVDSSDCRLTLEFSKYSYTYSGFDTAVSIYSLANSTTSNVKTLLDRIMEATNFDINSLPDGSYQFGLNEIFPIGNNTIWIDNASTPYVNLVKSGTNYSIEQGAGNLLIRTATPNTVYMGISIIRKR